MKEIMGIIVCLSIFILMMSYSYNKGHVRGFEKGVDETLDTVITIVELQIQSDDDTVTKLVLGDKDTVTYYLSNKTIK